MIIFYSFHDLKVMNLSVCQTSNRLHFNSSKGGKSLLGIHFFNISKVYFDFYFTSSALRTEDQSNLSVTFVISYHNPVKIILSRWNNLNKPEPQKPKSYLLTNYFKN